MGLEFGKWSAGVGGAEVMPLLLGGDRRLNGARGREGGIPGSQSKPTDYHNGGDN